MISAFWICSIITVISAFISLGFSIAALRSSNASTRINAMYVTSRSTAIAVACVIAMISLSSPWIVAIAFVMVIVQFIDAGIGIVSHDSMKTFGPLSLAVLNLAALIFLLR
jgi:hypothetical protein